MTNHRAALHRDTLERRSLMTDSPEPTVLAMAGAPTGRQATTRAVRNNNPGNIERGAKWIGLATSAQMNAQQRAENRFCVFSHPKYGFRAMAVTILTYARKRRARDGSAIDTIADVIARWAPPVENDTNSYANRVAQAVGVKRDALVDLETFEILFPMLKAMAIHEAGGWFFKDADLEEGLYMAGIAKKKLAPTEKREGVALALAGTLAAGGGLASIIAQATDAYRDAKPAIDEWLGLYQSAPTVAIIAALVPLAYAGWRFIRRMKREKA